MYLYDKLENLLKKIHFYLLSICNASLIKSTNFKDKALKSV